MRYLILCLMVIINVSCKKDAINDLSNSNTQFDISIISPLEGDIFGNNDIDFTGTASSPVGISKIELAIDSGEYKKIDGRTYWEYTYQQEVNDKLPQGSHIIKIRATDKKNNTKIQKIEIFIDREEPVAQYLYTPCSNNGLWNTRNVKFQLNEVSANYHFITSYQYSLNSGAWSNEIPIRTPITLTLPDNGNYKLETVVKNNREVWQSYDNPTIFNWEIDENATITNFTINNNDIITNSSDVTLNQYYGDFITRMYFSNTQDSYTMFDYYSSSIAWELENIYGQKTVYAKFNDVSSNQYETSDNIYYFRETIIEELDANPYNYFGMATDVSDNDKYMAVLAPNHSDVTCYNYISIYEKNENEWQEGTKLYLSQNTYVPSYVSDGMLPQLVFSHYGGTLVCLLPGDSGITGQGGIQLIIYTYNENAFQFFQSINIPYNGACSVSVNEIGDVIAVGVPEYNVGDKNRQGAVFIYQLESQTYKHTHTLIDSSFGDKGDRFGSSVSLVGGRGEYTLAVGAPCADVNGLPNKGYVSIYELYDQEWIFRQRLKSNRQDSAYTSFGFSVSLAKYLNNMYILVSAPEEWKSSDMKYRGVVYLYKKNLFNYKFEIENCFYSEKDISIGSAYDEQYGHKVHINQNADTFLVGATGLLHTTPDLDPEKIPSVYLYRKEDGKWLSQKLSVMNAIDRQEKSSIYHFGLDFGMSDNFNTFTVGSYGKLYLFSK